MECLEVHPDKLSKALDREVSEVLDLHLDRPGLEAPYNDPVLLVVTELVRHPDTKSTHCSRIQLIVVKLKSKILPKYEYGYGFHEQFKIPDHFDCLTKLDHEI